ncbi:MAG: hypothetical protein QOE65_2617 [Solirubrobacteraceae bacterium]|jgi:hypothetical protein|nr:hypothetical protein [Solirubrobacteraceae bacterium]
MLEASRGAITGRLGDEDRVLDVGGWSSPFPRADWVLDLNPHATRGRYGYSDADRASERFSAGTWVQRDACGPEPWPWPDDHFDFAVCSHTLEDLRDPLRVCAELGRVARAGYIEVPSRLEEQSRWVHGPWAGWSHHHWICDVRDGRIEFVFKGDLLQARRDLQVPRRVWARAGAEGRAQALSWEGAPAACERVFVENGDFARWLADGVPVRGRTVGARALAARDAAFGFGFRAADRLLGRGLSAR